MWRFLRNGLVIALVVAGGLKLALGFAARREVERIGERVAPWATLMTSGAGGRFDGSLDIDSPRLQLKTGPWRGTLAATSAHIETPGFYWLLRQALAPDDEIPPRFGIELNGFTIPDSFVAEIGPGWLGPQSLVPFETLGCGVVERLSAADYQKMGYAPAPSDDRVRYVYDAERQTLDVDASLSTPPFAVVQSRVALSHFTPAALADVHARDAVRIAQASLSYSDQGYMARRNRFCAQHVGIEPAAFVERHLAAVDTFLGARDLKLGDDARALYRSLILNGGTVELTSLPGGAFAPMQLAGYARGDLLRLLNVTARRNDSPPVMLRIAFVDPSMPVGGPPPETITVSAPIDPLDVGPAAASVGATVTPPATPAPTSTPPTAAIATTTVTTTLPPVATPSATTTSSLPSVVAEASAATTKPAAARPGEPPIDPLFPVLPASYAKPAPKPTVATPSPLTPPPAAIETPSDVMPSIPAPTGGDSTLALIWRGPVIERLPPKPVAERDYDAIAVGTLSGHLNARVRLIVASGQPVEGRVFSIDANDVTLAIKVAGGTAQLQVPRNTIREVQLLKVRSSAY